MIPDDMSTEFAKHHFDIFYEIISNKQGFSLGTGQIYPPRLYLAEDLKLTVKISTATQTCPVLEGAWRHLLRTGAENCYRH